MRDSRSDVLHSVRGNDQQQEAAERQKSAQIDGWALMVNYKGNFFCNCQHRAIRSCSNVTKCTCVWWDRTQNILETRQYQVAAQSKAWVYGRSFARIAGSNPAGCMDVCVSLVSLVCCQVKVPETGPIPHPGKTYRVKCISVLTDVTIILCTYNE